MIFTLRRITVNPFYNGAGRINATCRAAGPRVLEVAPDDFRLPPLLPAPGRVVRDVKRVPRPAGEHRVVERGGVARQDHLPLAPEEGVQQGAVLALGHLE